MTDLFRFLMLVPKTLRFLKLKNINIDFATVLANVALEDLEQFDLENLVNRRKPFNSNEIKAITESFPKLRSLVLDGAPLKDEDVQLFISKLNGLGKKLI